MVNAEPTWTEQQIREAYDHGSTAGVCEDVDDIISALHYRFHGWSEPCCSPTDVCTIPHAGDPDACACGYPGTAERAEIDAALEIGRAAAVCAAHGCSNRATGMRKSYVPGWPDEPDCGQHGATP